MDLDAQWLAQTGIDDWIEVVVLVLVVAAAGVRELIKFFSPKPRPEDQPDLMARKRPGAPPSSQARPVARPMPPIVVQRRTIIRTSPGGAGGETSQTTVQTVFPTAPASMRPRPPAAAPPETADDTPVVPEEVSSLPEVIFEMLGLPTPEAPRAPKSRQHPPRSKPSRRPEARPPAVPRPALAPRLAPTPEAEQPHQRVVADALTPAALQNEQTATDAASGGAPPEHAHASYSVRASGLDLHNRLHSHAALREAIVLSEILGPPLALRASPERRPLE